MKSTKVFVADAAAYVQTLKASMEWLEVPKLLSDVNGIFIKPNFTFPEFRAGVTTTKSMVHAAIEVFTDLHDNVVVGESDGGYGTFNAEQAFINFDLYDVCRKHKAALVNLCKVPSVECRLNTHRGQHSINLPEFLIKDNFVTVTLPVPKVHCHTGISLSYKNQWGCIPDMMRLRKHHIFDEVIGPINHLLKVKLSIIDGTYGLTGNGPIQDGVSVETNWIIASCNCGAADRVATQLMGLRLEDYSHYRHIMAQEHIPELDEIENNADLRSFMSRKTRFYLNRNIWNYLAKTTWYSPALTYLIYESKLGQILHRLMYCFRDRPKEFKEYKSPS